MPQLLAASVPEESQGIVQAEVTTAATPDGAVKPSDLPPPAPGRRMTVDLLETNTINYKEVGPDSLTRQIGDPRSTAFRSKSNTAESVLAAAAQEARGQLESPGAGTRATCTRQASFGELGAGIQVPSAAVSTAAKSTHWVCMSPASVDLLHAL